MILVISVLMVNILPKALQYIESGIPQQEKQDDYDFGIILLKSRKDDKNVCDVVDPITIDFDREAKEGDTWETLGYPVRDENPNVAMMKQTGVFVEKVGGRISKISKMEAFGDGGSGGVWLSAKSANGVHVSSSVRYPLSSSPYFTSDLMEDLKYTYFN